MATHSSVLAWRIPGTGEPGGLPSLGSHRVRHDWSDLAAAAATPLTGPDNPLLCLYFCYYLKWAYDNEMFTTVNTLNCSYEGLGEEISDLHSLRASKRIRLMAVSPGSQSQGTGLDCCTSWYLFPSMVDKPTMAGDLGDAQLQSRGPRR